MAEQTPNPGSSEAVTRGCTCPVADNCRGKGAYIDVDDRPVFWYTDGCPVHLPAGDGDASRVVLGQVTV